MLVVVAVRYARRVGSDHSATNSVGTEQRPIYAAGGVLTRTSASGSQIVLVHRPRYDDWTLPKGKLKAGEGWEAAALREVREETGYRATITSFAGPITYHVSSRPKLVLFWNMRLAGESCFEPSREVDACEWVTPADAVARLNYELERRLIADLFQGQLGSPPHETSN
jgi:8-oxo-dGTP diphosphatase